MEHLIEFDMSSLEKIDQTLPICVNNVGHYYITTPYVPTNRPNGRKDYQIIYVTSGTVRVTTENKQIMVKKGQLIFYKPHMPQLYDYLYKQPCETYWVHFYGTMVPEIISKLNLDDFFILDTASNYKIQQYIETMIDELITQHFGADYTCSGTLLLLLTEIANIKTKLSNQTLPNNNIGRLKFREVLLQMHNLKTNFSLDQLADIMKISPSRFSHSFKEIFGQSPYSYYLNIRINHAKTMLMDTTFSINEIANNLGYQDPFYFSRIFKKHTGMSPSAFRIASRN